MNKRFAAVLAAMAVAGVTSAFAANPFSDVTPSDWAYQSVAQLAQAGVINGYPDGTFKGQNNITRYEMAQMVAKAMANEARANAEQRAVINRLADEFSSELNTLGVRVSALENKVGNVKLTGDARLRYQGSNKDVKAEGGIADGKKSKFDYRVRFNLAATVNDNTTVNARFTTLGSARDGSMVEFGDASSNYVGFDQMNVVHKFGDKVSLTAGRYNEVIGGGLLLSDSFDGVKLAYNGKVKASASYGSMTYYDADLVKKNADDNKTYSIYQLAGDVAKNVTLGGFYMDANKNAGTLKDVYGFNVNAKLADKVWVGGEYTKFQYEGDVKGTNAWVAGLGYGTYDQAKAGTWDVKVQYFNFGENANAFSSTWSMPYKKDVKEWMATVDYALAKNFGLSGYYTFSAKDQAGNKKSDRYRVDLNYKF